MPEPLRTVHPPPLHPRRTAVTGPAVRPAVVIAQALVGAGALAVLCLWWFGAAPAGGAGGRLTDAGRVTGLLAGYAAAVLLLLMARVPWLDRTLGTDRLARWHARGGRITVSLMVAHALLVLSGKSVTEERNLVDETAAVLGYPNMLKAASAFLLLLCVAALSARAARRRVGYETWHALHLLTYLAVYLGFWHQLSSGAHFIGDRAARTTWYALYGTVAALLVWFRVLGPVRNALRHRLLVTEVRPEAPDVVSVYLTGRRLDRLRARPGQFMRWRFLAPGLWWTSTPYSLSAPPDGRSLRITVKGVGEHSRALARIAPGTRVWAAGPYGGLTASRARAGRSLLLAGGVGITPLRALFETLPGDTVLVYWARSATDLVLRGELDRIAAERGLRVVYSVSDPDGYRVPLDARSLRRLVPDLARRDVYVCGPPRLTRAALSALAEAGVPGSRVHHESFSL
ncbi:ferric reductase-like transmembrane domain-containing protein [Streptomyces sp. NPDC005955]|uniref:ferredoxin reductase family protein n=1 Tax=Streptomyces sp. NPDC005955 TaxID=3364738 RepID=UPI0036787640